MRLKKWLLLGSLSLPLSACGAERPDVTLCTLDSANFLKHAEEAQNLEDLKKIIDGGQPVYCVDTADDRQFDLTLKQADKHQTMPLKDFQKLQNYVIDLERKVEQCR